MGCLEGSRVPRPIYRTHGS